MTDDISNQGKFLMSIIRMNQVARAGSEEALEANPLAMQRDTRDMLMIHQELDRDERHEFYIDLAEAVWPCPEGYEVHEGWHPHHRIMLNFLKDEYDMMDEDIVDEDLGDD